MEEQSKLIGATFATAKNVEGGVRSELTEKTEEAKRNKGGIKRENVTRRNGNRGVFDGLFKAFTESKDSFAWTQGTEKRFYSSLITNEFKRSVKAKQT